MVAVLLAAGAARAQEMPRGREMGPPRGEPRDPENGMIERMLRSPELAAKLGLAEEQVRKLKDGVYALKLQEIDLRAELEKSGMEQAKLMTADNVDTDALMAVVEKTGQIRTELAKLRVKGLLLLKDTLTPDQLGEIRKQHRKRMDRMGEEGRFRFGLERRHGDRRPEGKRDRPDTPPAEE
jgi:Spy/CpxP family protein refolding chaperone